MSGILMSPAGGAAGPGPQNVVWNPATLGTHGVLSDSDKLLTAISGATGTYGKAFSAKALAGKSYVSGVCTLAGAFGICRASFMSTDATHWAGGPAGGSLGVYTPNGDVYVGGSIIGDTGSGTSPLGVEIHVDEPTRKIWVRQSGGAFVGGGDPAAGTSPTYTMPGSDALYVVGTVYALSPAGRSLRIHNLSEITGSPSSGYTAGNYAP